MSRLLSLRLLVLLAICPAWACEKVPLTSPTGSTISLSTNSNIVPVNGSVQITATVTESSGTAVQNGTTVVFTSDFGRMDPAEAQTQNGRATVRFVASGQSGTVKINAFSGAASTSGGTTSGALTLLVGGAAAGRISLRAEPPNIPQGGGTVQIFASVTDTNGNPLMGAPVAFTIGGTTGTGILGSPSAVTDANGQAQTSLTTNQTTTVTATVATTTAAALTANVVVTALAAPSLAIVCTAPTGGFSVGVAVNCTITLPTTSTTPIQNVTVNWGDGTGEQPVGNVTGATTVSHTYATQGTYTITASATDLNSQRGTAVATVVVQIIRPTITLTASSNIGSVGVPISFTVTPASNPPQPITNVTVEFGDGTSRNLGVISGPTTVAKTYTAEGTYTAVATVIDQSGQRGNGTTQVVIGRTASPTITFTQTSSTTPPATPATPETFSVSAASSTSGITIRSIVVTRANGDVLYNGSGGGSFAAAVTAGDVLTATATDSAGNTSTSQIVVQ